MLLTNAAPLGNRKPSAHSLHHCKPEGDTPRGRPPPPHPPTEPVVAGRRALWQTPFRARHGQLLLRSPGSGVRHRWLSNRRNRRPGPEEPRGVLRLRGPEGHQLPEGHPMSPRTPSPVAVTGSGSEVEQISALRTQIDACDAEIIELVERRLAI